MKRVLTRIVSAFMLVAVVQAQSSVTGKWEGQTQGGSQLTLDVTANETALTGTLTRDEEKVPIEKGTVSKNTFTFAATLGGQTEVVSGEVEEDQMTVWLDRQGRDRAIVLKRAKQK